MQAENIVDSIERFSLDLIGVIIPGLTHIIGVWLIFKQNIESFGVLVFPPEETGGVFLLLAAGYISGFVTISIGERVLMPLLDIWNLVIVKIPVKWCHKLTFNSRNQILRAIGKSNPYKLSVSLMRELYPSLQNSSEAELSELPADVREWRNLALSIVQEKDSIIYKFTAIGQMNLGVAAALLTNLAIWAIASSRLNGITQINWCLVVIGIVVSLLLLDRHGEFYRRAQSLPFSMVAAKLQNKQDKRAST